MEMVSMTSAPSTPGSLPAGTTRSRGFATFLKPLPGLSCWRYTARLTPTGPWGYG